MLYAEALPLPVEWLPALVHVAGVLVVVWWFLAHIRASENAQQKMDESRQKAMENLGLTCHAFQQDMSRRAEDVFDRVSSALDENTRALGRNTEALDQLDRLLETRQPKRG